MSLMNDIKTKMTGRVALLSEEEADLLVEIAAIPGDHIDLGTLWGGTAVLAALAKQNAGVKGKVYTVDFMQGGYWNDGDPSVQGQRPTEQAIHDNLAKFDLADKVVVIKAASDPWPVPASVHPTSVLIDCDHTYEGSLRDWQTVRKLQPVYVAFHDYNPATHPGVSRLVDEIKKNGQGYRLYKQAGTLVVFQTKIDVMVSFEEEPVKAPAKAPAKKPATRKAKPKK